MSLTKAIINLKNLKENLDYLKSISKNANIYPVIKANAYGHGLLKIAKFLDKEKIEGVCVATENEVEQLIKLNLSSNKGSIKKFNLFADLIKLSLVCKLF